MMISVIAPMSNHAMNPEFKTTAQITTTAIKLLCREIGPANTARFISQFTVGSGDKISK